ncbi:plasmid mobilization protein [Helicobacter pylori]|uniref:plasmid mobilization protein n=1 Tax=Helicobacter pylori TaxID=210 RepID=UPI0002F2DBFA|nr:plasmid mobilization relaxosome protein MobC [Helicobacter pylori]
MRKQVDTNKQIIKSLRLSKKQWQTIQTQMQEKNLNFSQLVLNSILHQNSQTPIKSKKQKAIANKELVIELAKWGNNLNQIAKNLNTNQGVWDRLGLEQLIEISHQLEQIRFKYVG